MQQNIQQCTQNIKSKRKYISIQPIQNRERQFTKERNGKENENGNVYPTGNQDSVGIAVATTTTTIFQTIVPAR